MKACELLEFNYKPVLLIAAAFLKHIRLSPLSPGASKWQTEFIRQQPERVRTIILFQDTSGKYVI